ncbi:histidine kinase [Desulfofarcimen acetoxidans DSM 771]|uniref:histidine kinase n=1 Tax=Desulfofarcimen acetoxidans (strain ATCC 49208 / DSM 771 / KCTC 5769 / VKM B-1644 / 5575) TaxID=485916 RepID=C8W0J5_DESAS|nr:sensor histidine kinase [Desulfofarcimen acetoxidans]ACV63250.1 histidine kinase [Desulfofarcimen acetoxidans DSM 771]
MPSFSFSASSKVKDLVGRRLVTNKHSALFELVKNSYDADADKVNVSFNILEDTLTIDDDGDGMSLNEIENKWMVIGTDSKQGKLFTSKGRVLNGEKGIGRFSADRLGNKLEMIACVEESEKAIRMIFDWNLFENTNYLLDDIQIDYSYIDKPKLKGLTLIISGLRDAWTIDDIVRVEKKLSGLLSPVGNTDDFAIYLNCQEYGVKNKQLIPYSISDISSIWINVEVPVNDTDIINYRIYRNGAELDKGSYNNTYNFGPVNVLIYSFTTGDKISFKHKFSIDVVNFGNIRIYRDNFQIYPYGEHLNDWLGLDRRKTQGHFRNLGSREVIGYIQIYREHNKGLIDATNRQGLEENKDYDELKQFIKKEALTKLESEFYFKKNKDIKSEARSNREEIIKTTKEVKEIAKKLFSVAPSEANELVDLSNQLHDKTIEQDKIIRNQLQVIEIYKRAASKETLLQKIIHQAFIRAQNISTAISNTEDDLKTIDINPDARYIINKCHNFIKERASEIGDFLVSVREKILKKREKININIIKSIKRVINHYMPEFRENGIECIVEGDESLIIYFDPSDFKVILENLISNSKKALNKCNTNDKFIHIRVINNDSRINIFFRDNGIGIPPRDAAHVFIPFYTTTDGFGMGLAIVDELIKDNGGEIQLVQLKPDESGAEFQITFKR